MKRGLSLRGLSLFPCLHIGLKKRVARGVVSGGDETPHQPSVEPPEVQECKVPVELIIAILRLTKVPSVVMCRTVTRQFQAIIDHTVELQYMIALYIAGLEENAHLMEATNVAERLRILDEYEAYWKAARFASQRITEPISAAHIGLWYEGGLFIRPTPDWAVQFGFHQTHKTLLCQHFTQLSSNAISPTWRVESLYDFDTFAVHPERDLVALLSLEATNIAEPSRIIIRLLSLSDGTPCRSIEFPPLSYVFEGSIVMRFEQDILGIAMKGAFDVVDFHLFDWTTGSLIANSSNRCNPDHRKFILTTFTFISSKFFILGTACLDSFYTIQLYSIEDLIFRMDSTVPAPRHIATFQLPAYQPQLILEDQLTFTKTTQGSFLRERSNNPFFLLPSSSMLRIDGIWARNPNGMGHSSGHRRGITIFVHPSSFLKILSRDPNSDCYGIEFFPWETWGPEYSRCFDVTYNARQLYASYGTRIVLDNSLLDFNPLSVARELGRVRTLDDSHMAEASTPQSHAGHTLISSDPVANTRVVTAPTIIERGRFFANDIETTLPYLETDITWPNKVQPDAIFANDSVWIAEYRDLLARSTTYKALSVHASQL